ncbi:hypothetical protein EMCRGX_G033247 [Ephydatia muelleri]
MVRWATFPIIFSAVLIAAAATFYNRRSLLPGTEESRIEKAIESHRQAVDFKARVAEGIAEDTSRSMDVRDFRSSGRVKLSLSRKRIKLDETLTGSRDPGDDSNPEVLGAASDKKSCCSLTGTHLEAERLENTQPSSRRLRHADAEEPRGGEHVNKCFETQSGRSQQAEVPAAHVCVLCAKPFKSEQSKLLHMKQCAKRDGISTEALVQLNRVAVESLLTAPLTAPLSNQSNCPAVTSETAAGGEMDFKPSLSKGRKPKKQKAPTDYLQLINEDQLQMALALSASIDTRTSSITAEHQQRPGGKRTRQQKMCDDVIPPLLLTTTTESEKLLAARAEMILVPSEDLHGKEDDIASTQPFPPSRLGQSAPPTSCAKGVSFGDKDTLVGGGDCVDREGYSENNHLVVQSSIPSVPHGSTCDWLNLSRDNAHKDTDPQEGSVIDSSALRTEAGLLGCGGDHLEYPTVWHLTGYQNTATIDCFYVPALKTVISPVKHTSDVLASVVTPAMPMPSFGGVERLLADLHGLLGSTSFSDVVMVTRNGTRIPSHAAILSSRCPSLREVLHGSHSSPVLLDLTEFSSECGEVASLVERCLRGEGLAELCVATPGSSEGWGGGESRRTFPADTQRLSATPSQGSPVLLAPRSFVQISSQATSVHRSTQCVGITQPAEQLPMASMEGNDVIKCAVAPLECGMTDCPIPSEGCVLTISPAPPEGLNVSPAPQEGRGLNISPAPQEGRGLINSPILIDSSTSDEEEEGGPVNGMGPSSSPSALSCAAIRGVSGVLASPPDKSCDETLIFNELCSRSCDQEFTTCLLTARPCDIDAVEQHPSGVHDNLGSTLHPVGSPVECHSPLVHTSRPMDLSSSRQSVCGVHPAVLPHPHSPSNGGCSVSVFSSPGKLDTPTSSPVQPNYPEHISSPVTISSSPSYAPCSPDNVTESEPHPSLGADHLPRLAVRDHMTCVATPTTCDGAGENDVTPMPDYQTMRTPALRDQCTRYGVRPLPKRKMIAKLREIYEYTHPMADQSAEAIISSSQPAVNKGLVAMETSPVAASDEICGSQPTTSVIAKAAKHRSGMNLQELRDSVREAIMKDQELYRRNPNVQASGARRCWISCASHTAAQDHALHAEGLAEQLHIL